MTADLRGDWLLLLLFIIGAALLPLMLPTLGGNKPPLKIIMIIRALSASLSVNARGH